MKDHLGNDALDYGTRRELMEKYTDNSFVYITKNMIGDNSGYVLFITDHHDKAHEWIMEFSKKMKEKGLSSKTFVCVMDGDNYHARRMDGFMGVNFIWKAMMWLII